MAFSIFHVNAPCLMLPTLSKRVIKLIGGDEKV